MLQVVRGQDREETNKLQILSHPPQGCGSWAQLRRAALLLNATVGAEGTLRIFQLCPMMGPVLVTYVSAKGGRS